MIYEINITIKYTEIKFCLMYRPECKFEAVALVSS